MSKKKKQFAIVTKILFSRANIYIYIRITVFFKRCIQHLAAGARSSLVKEVFLIDVVKVTLPVFENIKP